MKYPLTLTLLVAAVQLSGHTATAQVASSLSGTITDSLTHQALPYVTVLVRPYGSSNVLFNTLTNDKGAFTFEGLPAGQYSLAGKYLGYKDFLTEPVVAGPGAPAGPALVVALAPERKLLKGVTVVGTKPFIEQQAGKIVLNVASSPIAAGSTADEVLSRAPGVLESGGGYTVRGRQATVLLDGKYTNLSGADLKAMLAAMPSNTVDKVEVFTNPSAKYDAQGGSIINITTTKNRGFGTNGSLSEGIGAGRYARYNTGLSLNYRQNKLNLYGGYDYLRNKQFIRSQSQRSISSEAQLNEQSNTVNERRSHSAKLGFDYDLNKTSSVGVLVKTLVNLRDGVGGTTSILASPAGGLPRLSTVQSTAQTRFLMPSVNAYYRSTAGKPGTELRLSADYFGYNRAVHGDIGTNFLDDSGTPYAPPSYLRNNSPADNSVKSVAVDYTRPLESSTLELGAKTTFTRTDNDIRWEQLAAGSSWQTDPGKTNHFVYRENINALYANLSKKVEQVSIVAGLRAEQTNTTGTSLTTGQVTERNYLNLFPSLSLDYALSEKQQLNLAYQRRIDRFKLDVVNPFVTYVSQYYYFQGNPTIRPSISDNFSFTHVYHGELSTSINYSRHQNVLTEVYRPKDATAVLSTFENASRGESVDLMVSHSKQLLSNKWSTNNTAALSYARIYSTAEAGLNAATPTAYFVTNNSITLAKGLKLELYANYFLPWRFGAYAFKSHYTTSLGVSKSVLQGAGNLTLNVSDAFNTLNSRYDVSSYGVNSTNITKAESQFVRLNFTYKFGNKNVKSSKSRRQGTEAEQRRLELN
ncbi:outer membrane beta-barrel family protein [Hymenobacter algoricola]|uniref:TonB-dependent receptor n=1 Tax=Hymenobacter algoricola TaxID=486267 RepID=A0ABP7NTI4_9BACT